MSRPGPLPGQPQSGGEPVFDAPWQARAFAMAVHLNERGLLPWTEWSSRLSAVIEHHEREGAVRTGDDYYGLWVETIEAIVAELDSR